MDVTDTRGEPRAVHARGCRTREFLRSRTLLETARPAEPSTHPGAQAPENDRRSQRGPGSRSAVRELREVGSAAYALSHRALAGRLSEWSRLRGHARRAAGLGMGSAALRI